MSDAVLAPWQRRRLPRLPSAPRQALAAGLLVVALMLAAGAANILLELRADHAPAPAAPPPDWIDVPRPIRIFDLNAPLLRGVPLVYSARRRSDGDAREDMLVYGVPGADLLAFRLRLTRRTGGSAAPPPPLFASLARQAAESGLSVTRERLADLLPTRFGKFEIADVTLSGAGAAQLSCSGFRLALDPPALAIGGLACGSSGKSIDRATLACLLDRLDLASGGDDRAMIDFFAASERRRDANCTGAGLAPDHLHAAWLDDKAATHGKTSRRH